VGWLLVVGVTVFLVVGRRSRRAAGDVS
jgi:hypothetical protein